MSFMGRAKSWIGWSPALPAAPPSTDIAQKPGWRSEFMRGGRGQTMSNWHPALREIQQDVSNSWDSAAARTMEIIQNSGWIAGTVDQAVANTVGTGLRLKCQPENSIFGMSDADAATWAQLVEQRFGMWANSAYECDVEARRTFGQMQAAALRSWFATGEILYELPWRIRPGGTYGTKVRMIQANRLLRDTFPTLAGQGPFQGAMMINGIIMDRDYMPVGYRIARYEPLVGTRFVDVPARDAMGRPGMVHVYEGTVGQYRGLSPLVPALQVAKQFDQLADATLMASIMQTVFAATITTEEPTDEFIKGLLSPSEQARIASQGLSPLDAWFEAQVAYYQAGTIDVGINGRMAHLFPGQKMEFHTPTNPQTHYEKFALHLLRELARCLGVTYESATGDYTGATYSSVRMAVNDIFAITLYRRANIVAPFCQPAYEAWLEEEIEYGRIPFPGGINAFMANRTAACRAAWKGSPKPQADDVKAATAHDLWRTMGVLTDESIANDLGTDIEDVYAQRKKEQDMRDKLGLIDPLTIPIPKGTPKSSNITKDQ